MTTSTYNKAMMTIASHICAAPSTARVALTIRKNQIIVAIDGTKPVIVNYDDNGPSLVTINTTAGEFFTQYNNPLYAGDIARHYGYVRSYGPDYDGEDYSPISGLTPLNNNVPLEGQERDHTTPDIDKLIFQIARIRELNQGLKTTANNNNKSFRTHYFIPFGQYNGFLHFVHHSA